MADSLEQQIRRLEQEILDIKISQRLAPRIRCYAYKFTIGSASYTNGHGRVTYGAGDSDIVSDFQSDVSIWAGNPSGNTQDFYAIANTGSAMLNAPIYIMSTRPIVSVQMLD